MSVNFKQGRYTIPARYRHKYIGDYNNIFYRSKWEKTFMDYLCQSPNVKRWNSEDLVVKYINQLDGRVHEYFIDFYVEIDKGNDEVAKYWIECKPYSQTKPPKQASNPKTYNYQLRTYITNMSKWKYAKEAAERNGAQFKILTERSGIAL